ncbi:hypothetical protein RYA05_03020 [Pseudomonas syringae pv. actinidiae]|nr:hypothetical protein [Pseudomonas syringae pv. actinidiae]
MSQNELLKTGDIFLLKAGMAVTIRAPKKFVFRNRQDSMEMTTAVIEVGSILSDGAGNTLSTVHLAGEYIVVGTSLPSADDNFVIAKQLASDGSYDEDGIGVSFYQSGNYTSQISPDETPVIRKMKQTFVAA